VHSATGGPGEQGHLAGAGGRRLAVAGRPGWGNLDRPDTPRRAAQGPRHPLTGLPPWSRTSVATPAGAARVRGSVPGRLCMSAMAQTSWFARP